MQHVRRMVLTHQRTGGALGAWCACEVGLSRGLDQEICLLETNTMVLLEKFLEHKCRKLRLNLGALVPIVVPKIKSKTTHAPK